MSTFINKLIISLVMANKVTKWQILLPYLTAPKERFHLRELARKTNHSHQAIFKTIGELVSERVLISEKKGRQIFYKLNTENSLLVDYLSISEKYQLILSCKNLLLKEFVSLFRLDKASSDTVILFGSFVKDAKKANDIDVLVVGEYTKEENFLRSKGILGKEIHLIRVKSFDKVSSTLKEEIVKNHLILNNVEGSVKWMLQN